MNNLQLRPVSGNNKARVEFLPGERKKVVKALSLAFRTKRLEYVEQRGTRFADKSPMELVEKGDRSGAFMKWFGRCTKGIDEETVKKDIVGEMVFVEDDMRIAYPYETSNYKLKIGFDDSLSDPYVKEDAIAVSWMASGAMLVALATKLGQTMCGQAIVGASDKAINFLFSLPNALHIPLPESLSGHLHLGGLWAVAVTAALASIATLIVHRINWPFERAYFARLRLIVLPRE